MNDTQATETYQRLMWGVLSAGDAEFMLAELNDVLGRSQASSYWSGAFRMHEFRELPKPLQEWSKTPFMFRVNHFPTLSVPRSVLLTSTY